MGVQRKQEARPGTPSATLPHRPDLRDRVIAVSVRGVVHQYREVRALDGVSLEIAAGEFVTLLGASGSGKTTLLRVIAGLIQPTDGKVFIDGRDVTAVPPQGRGVGFVFQNYALFPHLTIYENVAYPLRIRRVSDVEVRRRVAHVLELVGLPDVGQRRTAQLSGGQQQRIAVARALVYGPAVLLMDEPLGALDRKLRKRMQLELRRLQHELSITCIYVTHDQEEALTMSDRVAVMHDGHILQIANADGLYRSPISPFVADFVGDTNLLRGRIEHAGGRTVVVTDHGTHVELAREVGPIGASVTLSIRPESVHLRASADDAQVSAVVEQVVFVGNLTQVYCRTSSGEEIRAEVQGSGATTLATGDRLWLRWADADVNVFPAENG